MKALYEITNGWTGCSYVRLYVWADDPAEAHELAWEKYQEQYPDSEIEKLQMVKLFDSNRESFATEPNDEGFVPGIDDLPRIQPEEYIKK